MLEASRLPLTEEGLLFGGSWEDGWERWGGGGGVWDQGGRKAWSLPQHFMSLQMAACSVRDMLEHTPERFATWALVNTAGMCCGPLSGLCQACGVQMSYAVVMKA